MKKIEILKAPVEGSNVIGAQTEIMWSIIIVHTIVFYTKTSENTIFCIVFPPLLLQAVNSTRKVLFQNIPPKHPKIKQNVKNENYFHLKNYILKKFVMK